MRLNSKGQVTIPAELRRKHHLHEGDEVDVVDDGQTLRIVAAPRVIAVAPLVDTNVLLNAIVFAEVSTRFARIEDLEEYLPESFARHDLLPCSTGPALH